MYRTCGLLSIDDVGEQWANDTDGFVLAAHPGPVAGAATEKHGLAAHRANGLPVLRSPKEPLVPERPKLRLGPDAPVSGPQGAVSWPETRAYAAVPSDARSGR